MFKKIFPAIFIFFCLNLPAFSVMEAAVETSAERVYSLEECIDIALKNDPNIKIIKDISASAVFVACFAAFVYGLVIYIPAIIKLFL